MYRNWPAICEMSTQSKLLMFTLASVDLETSIGKRLISAFPECFSDEFVKGPIPLSVLIEELRDDDDDPQGIDTDLVQKGILRSYDIPSIIFCNSAEESEEFKKQDLDRPVLPDYLDYDKIIGDIVTHNGEEHVVVEVDGISNEIAICSTQYINPSA